MLDAFGCRPGARRYSRLSTGRQAPGDVLDYFVRDLRNRLSVATGARRRRTGSTKLLARPGVVDSLNTFARLSTSDSATDAQFADAVEDVKKRITHDGRRRLFKGLAALDDPNAIGGPAATGIHGMRVLLDSLSVDIAGQVASRIKGEAATVGNRLATRGGDRLGRRARRLPPGRRLVARRQGPNGVHFRGLVRLHEREVRQRPARRDGHVGRSERPGLRRLGNAAQDTEDRAGHDAGPDAVVVDGRYYAKVTVDAIAYAALDQLTAAKALDLPIPGLDTLISGFQASLAQQDITTQLVPDPSKIDSAWSNGKKNIKDVPPGLTLNLVGRLATWKKAAWPSKGQPDLDAAAEAALDVAEAVADYRRRIQIQTEVGPRRPPAGQATLLAAVRCHRRQRQPATGGP